MKRVLTILFVLLMCSGCYYVKSEDSVVRKDTDKTVFTDNELDKIEDEIEYDYVGIDEVDIEVAGKIIYMEIEYRDRVTREEAMEDCRDYITYFDSKKLDNYDLNMTLDGNGWYVATNYSDNNITFSVE